MDSPAAGLPPNLEGPPARSPWAWILGRPMFVETRSQLWITAAAQRGRVGAFLLLGGLVMGGLGGWIVAGAGGDGTADPGWALVVVAAMALVTGLVLRLTGPRWAMVDLQRRELRLDGGPAADIAPVRFVELSKSDIGASPHGFDEVATTRSRVFQRRNIQLMLYDGVVQVGGTEPMPASGPEDVDLDDMASMLLSSFSIMDGRWAHEASTRIAERLGVYTSSELGW